jgi:hypothetical protein
MTQLQDNRCFGRLKAQELSEEEMARVGGGQDFYHANFLCPNNVSEGNENQPCSYIGLGCIET